MNLLPGNPIKAKSENPASTLVGAILNDRWKVIKKLSKDETNSTGGAFSVPYRVADLKTGKEAFLKVIDMIRSLQMYTGLSLAESMVRIGQNHSFEVYLSEICKNKRMTRIVHAIDHGEHMLNVEPWGSFPFHYIVFELADGDVHTLLTIDSKLGTLWKINTLHQVATAVQQLHKENIAHQDIKRSNVVFFGPQNAKLTDLGRAVQRDSSSRNDDRVVPCQFANSPPELLYGHKLSDWAQVHFATDLYMLGNLAFTLFFDVTMTATLFQRIPPGLQPRNYNGEYSDVLPALQHALGEILVEIEPQLPEPIRDDYLSVIRWLCNPDPTKRGHPKDHAMKHSNKYSAERFITVFDMIKRKGIQIFSK